ncbi:Nuclear factor NF-kappa-B p105 subunit [Dissostichus eleginoides]|uniref:Nuclear factor NF-kappa-B p105 subunit n=1 Tax=Dissostichus eleginoides TaxID=100907 RepID=A0AAD9B202_DISEL|nr:Nuclear factor NF-kappa-B p105 subunit [Dissostichus eleginoides]
MNSLRGADPQKENFEPLFFREEECGDEEGGEEEDEGYIPGNTPFSMAASAQVSGGTVRDLLAGLRSVGECRALSVLEEALRNHNDTQLTNESGA